MKGEEGEVEKVEEVKGEEGEVEEVEEVMYTSCFGACWINKHVMSFHGPTRAL